MLPFFMHGGLDFVVGLDHFKTEEGRVYALKKEGPTAENSSMVVPLRNVEKGQVCSKGS